MSSENSQQQNSALQELAKFQKLMQEQVQYYSFHNDHIMRGPLCRAMGLIDLIKREELTNDAISILDMLEHELKQIESVTIQISRMLDNPEKNVQNFIDENK